MHASNFNLHSICISYFVLSLVYYLYEAVRMCAYFIYICQFFFFGGHKFSRIKKFVVSVCRLCNKISSLRLLLLTNGIVSWFAYPIGVVSISISQE